MKEGEIITLPQSAQGGAVALITKHLVAAGDLGEGEGIVLRDFKNGSKGSVSSFQTYGNRWLSRNGHSHLRLVIRNYVVYLVRKSS